MKLMNIPLPPSSNLIYNTVMIHGYPRRVKSAKMRTWLREMEGWAYNYPEALRDARLLVSNMAADDVLKVDAVFCFQKGSVLTLKGKPKKLDVSNRVKCLHDRISELIGIDDSYFWETSEKKTIANINLYDEWVDLTFSVVKIFPEGS